MPRQIEMGAQRFGHRVPDRHARIEHVVRSRHERHAPPEPRHHVASQHADIDRIEHDSAGRRAVEAKQNARKRVPSGSFVSYQRERRAAPQLEGQIVPHALGRRFRHFNAISLDDGLAARAARAACRSGERAAP
jgi:hypothetical protein